MSIGIVLIGECAAIGFDEAYRAADQALYGAKLQGKNGWWLCETLAAAAMSPAKAHYFVPSQRNYRKSVPKRRFPCIMEVTIIGA